jgi:hypothetical protein
MTLFHLADNITVTSANPVKVINVSSVLGAGPVNQMVNRSFQCEVNSTAAATCTAAFQFVGSFDPEQNLPPLGVGGAWSNIGTAQTITCSTPGVTPAVAVVSSTVPYHRVGVIISSISGTGAVASALMDG